MRGQDGLSLNLYGLVVVVVGGGVPDGGDRPAECPVSLPYSMQLATISSNSLVNDLRMFFFCELPPKCLFQVPV